jgi:type IV pilus assembly protein PilN
MRLDINLATHPYEDSRQFWLRWGTGLALLGIVTLGLLYWTVAGWVSAQKDRDLIAKYEQQIAARDQERAAGEAILNRPENRSVRDRSQFLNDLFQRKAFSWTKVFEDLERVMPNGLHVVSIKPETTDQEQLKIKLVVGGNSRDRALELVRKMETSKHFQMTQIESEAPTANQNGGDTIEFNISALYVAEAGAVRNGGAL